MKKRLIVAAIALLGSAGAFAESSVTVFGFIDAAVGKDSGNAHKGMLDEYGSRLGFKGERDLGNGLTGSFYLEHRLNPQTGTDQGSGVGSDTFWKGGSWVALGGSFGKVTLGRWWSQAFLKSQYASDPFGMGTVDETYGTVGCGPNTGCTGAFWVNNSVTYEFSAGGVSFGVQAAEKPVGVPNSKNPLNFGISYGDGPLYVGFGYESHEGCCANTTGGDNTWSHFTFNYDFKVAKLYTGYGTGHTDTAAYGGGDFKVSNMVIGFSAPMGQGTLLGAWNRFKDDTSGSSTVVRSKVSLGYQYQLDKSTKLYTTVTSDSKAATSKSGYDVGILYAF